MLDITTMGAFPGLADNTDAIQKAIDTMELVYVPKGTFMVDAVKGLHLHNGSRLTIDGALKAIPNSAERYGIIQANDVSDIAISLGGSIIGDVFNHQGKTGQWGFGISLNNVSNASIVGTGGPKAIIASCWGDAIYIDNVCKNITISGISALFNRRQGLSVISVEGLRVIKSLFAHTSGTAPSAGIDLEPDLITQFIKDVEITECRLEYNAGAGVQFGLGVAPLKNFINVRVHKNTFIGNKPIGGLDPWYAKALYATTRWVPGYDWWGYPREVHLK